MHGELRPPRADESPPADSPRPRTTAHIPPADAITGQTKKVNATLKLHV